MVLQSSKDIEVELNIILTLRKTVYIKINNGGRAKLYSAKNISPKTAFLTYL